MTDEPKPTAEGAEPEETPETAVDASAEEAPKPKRPRRRKAAAAEPEAAEATEAAAEPEAEEAPKPKRARRKPAAPKAEEQEAEEQQAEEQDEEEPVSADVDADADAEEADDDEAGEAKPRRGRRRSAETAAPAPTPVHRTAPARRAADGTVVVRAQAKYVRCAPRKARLVVDHIRGKSVDDARAILTHTPRAAAKDVLKLLESAVANAENNHELDADDLVIRKVYVDEGPTLKRYRPRALGRATRIRKRTSHMTIQLSPKE
jgi:large subunit ribosomal protein L22